MEPINASKDKNGLKSLNKRLLTFMILCWFVPIAVFFTFTIISYRRGIIDKVENLMEKELANTASIMSIRLNEVISLCQRPSYERTWELNWENYQNGSMTQTEFLQNINSSLRGKFYLDERFNMYAFYLFGSENPDCYGSRTGILYNDYIKNVQKEMKDIMERDTSYAYVKVLNGKIYIIRNLYTTSEYQRYGTFIVEVNRDKVFQDVGEDMKRNMMICVGNAKSGITFYDAEALDDEQRELFGEMRWQYDGRENGVVKRSQNANYNAYLYERSYDGYHIGVIVIIRREVLYSSLYSVYEVAAGMMLLFLPLMIYSIYFLRRQIQTPVKDLLEASKRMEEGEIGVTVSGEEMPNQEFSDLKDAFNRMSHQVKYLFDSVYNEKLERKDAQIQALQAQMNPHFLNNTLEMMNWQARMSGDVVVSQMIEALGTVLDYRMNRANVKEIHLSEELRCTDAYFYIMSMRFGQRLRIEREIDESLMGISVPPLILQPIVENAIVHGVEAVKNGVIELKIFHDEENVYLRVINNGKPISDEDAEWIQAILAGDDTKLPKQRGRHTSIGIRNVNLRIKLVYGEEYGLWIKRGEDDRTVSTMILPYAARDTGREEAVPKGRDEGGV